MKRRLILMITVTTVLALLAGCTSASAQDEVQEQERPDERTLTLSGSGQVSARPDVAMVTLGVQTQADEASAAVEQNNSRMQALIDALKDAGVAAEDIQTRALNLQPRYQETETRAVREIAGYEATNTVEVRVQDLNALGELLDTAVAVGGNRISGIRFEISDPGALLEQAREAAWNDAEQKATQLADLAGVELGEVLRINETGRTPVPVVRESLAAEAAAVPVEPGSQSVEVNINVTWGLR